MSKLRTLLARSGSALPPSCIYRFLISSKAKWSTPTDKVLMTLRLAPVVQKTHMSVLMGFKAMLWGRSRDTYLLFLK